MTNGRTLPWLRDISAVDVWASWGVEYRDVIVLDGAGVRRGVLNLTTHDLQTPAHRAALKQKLLEAR